MIMDPVEVKQHRVLKRNNSQFGERLLCLGRDGTFLRTVGGILCIYYGIWFALIGVVLTFIFPAKSAKLLKVIDPMITEWWYGMGCSGELITLIWGVFTTVIVYTHPDSLFSVMSSKLIYGLGNICAAKLGAEIAALNMKRCAVPLSKEHETDDESESDPEADGQEKDEDDMDLENEGEFRHRDNVTLLGETL